MIKVANYGSGNVKAIFNIYKRLGIQCEIAQCTEELGTATKIILPGVGAFDETISQLERSGMTNILNELVLEKKVPILGICVGMQVMADSSEEGQKKGLGWIKGTVRKIQTTKIKHKPLLPHMGWNNVVPRKQDSLFENVDIDRGFYFLHSYYFECLHEADVLACMHYGGDLTCAVKADNIYGFQFHPEKSHNNGINLLKNFAGLQ